MAIGAIYVLDLFSRNCTLEEISSFYFVVRHSTFQNRVELFYENLKEPSEIHLKNLPQLTSEKIIQNFEDFILSFVEFIQNFEEFIQEK